jgi:hypothetical protein
MVKLSGRFVNPEFIFHHLLQILISFISGFGWKRRQNQADGHAQISDFPVKLPTE